MRKDFFKKPFSQSARSFQPANDSGLRTFFFLIKSAANPNPVMTSQTSFQQVLICFF